MKFRYTNHFNPHTTTTKTNRPLVQNAYDWTVTDANALFTFAGVLSLISILVLQMLSRRVSDGHFLLVSFAMAAVGYGLLTVTRDSGMFLVGFSLLSVAFPIGRASCVALYTKKLPKQLQHVGQGVLLAVGGVARIVGPFPAALAVEPTRHAAATAGVFGSAAMGFAACAAWQMHAVDGR